MLIYRSLGLAAITVALAACQVTVNVPVTPKGSPSPVPTEGATSRPPLPGPTDPPSPSARPSYPPQTSPSTAPSATPPTQPYPSAPGTGLHLVIVSGTIYDEASQPVDGAVVTVTSLDASVPYKAACTSSQGSWVVNNVPDGANVEILATKDGWTSRRRVASFQDQGLQKNVVDFGGNDPGAGGYFISNYPEIASLDPYQDSSSVDPNAGRYKLVLSEPLDDANRERFADAIRLLPASQQAAPDSNGDGFLDLTNAPVIDRAMSSWAYALRNGGGFLGAASSRAVVTWDATGTVATLSSIAPLNAGARYQLALAAGDRPIVDPDGLQLGQDANYSWSHYPAADHLVHATVRKPDAPSIPNGTGAAQRWAASHLDASRFGTSEDHEAPVLVAAAYTRNIDRSSRFELTFSEPLATLDGSSTGHVSAGISSGTVLGQLTFAASDRTGGTLNVSLTGQPGVQLDPTGGSFGSQAQLEREFGLHGRLAPYGQSFTEAQAAGSDGSFLLQVSPDNPKTLFVYVIGVPNVFGSKIVELKARVAGLADPAGNAITSADANAQQVVTSVQ